MGAKVALERLNYPMVIISGSAHEFYYSYDSD